MRESRADAYRERRWRAILGGSIQGLRDCPESYLVGISLAECLWGKHSIELVFTGWALAIGSARQALRRSATGVEARREGR
jgi:hypothetical protein